jgi:hypothetical protein
VGPDLPEPGRRSEKEAVTIDPRQLWRAIERRGLGGTAALALGLNHTQPHIA